MRVRAGLLAAALAAPAVIGTGLARADIAIAVAGPMSTTPLTGQYATFGEELRRGAEMAVRDINDQGGIDGRKLTLLVGDDAGCDPKVAVEVAEELVRQGVVFVDGHYCSGASIPASRVYRDKSVLMISPGSTNPRLTDQGFANVFRVCGRDDAQGAFGADYALDHELADKVAIVDDRSAYGKGIADEFRRRLNERGVREAMDEAVAQGDEEFGGLIARMRDRGIGLVYFGGYFTESGLFVRQARAQGLGATMMVTSGSFSPQYWDLAGPAAEGTLATFGPEPRELPPAAGVVRRFEAEGFSPEGYTLYAYAAVQVFADAAMKAGSTGLDALEKALHAGTHETVLGPITFDEKGDVRDFRYSMYRWHDGRHEEICCRHPSGQ